MDTTKLTEFAQTIKHCGDYGGLWIDSTNTSVVWVAGDGDFDPDEVEAGICSSTQYIIDGFKSFGVEKVEINDEWEPDESEGWTFLGRFGFDNYYESKNFWQNYWDNKMLQEIHEKQIPLEELNERDKRLLYADIESSMKDASEDAKEYAGIKDMSDL